MSTLAELKKQLVSESAAVRARKESGLDWKQQQAKCSALALQIVRIEASQKRLGALLNAVAGVQK